MYKNVPFGRFVMRLLYLWFNSLNLFLCIRNKIRYMYFLSYIEKRIYDYFSIVVDFFIKKYFLFNQLRCCVVDFFCFTYVGRKSLI